MNKNILIITLVVSAFFSCKKDLNKGEGQGPLSLDTKTKLYHKTNFSKTLAITLDREPSLRALIKNEALKQFDKDNDVLYQMIKDVKVEGNETVYDKLIKYASSKVELDAAIEALPTLTIMVPELPVFTPLDWNASIEIPQVAVAPESKGSSVNIYNAKGEITKMPFGYFPAFPVVVVKENERVNVRVNGVDRSPKSAVLLHDANGKNNAFFSTGNKVFSFSNEAFDGLSGVSLSQASVRNQVLAYRNDNKTSRIVGTGDGIPSPPSPFPPDPNYVELDQSIIDAYNLKLDWHRDYIYYGINPDAGIILGKFNSNFREHLVSIKMLAGIGAISDQDEDPRYDPNAPLPPAPPPRG